MPKRKFEDILTEEKVWSEAPINKSTSMDKKKNSLDSDEEDDDANEANYNVMHENDFEGVEEGPMSKEAKVGFTAFNMKEELEEGHFDKDGHYLWDKEKKIRDNWLDNIDWIKIEPRTGTSEDNANKDGDDNGEKGIADSESDDEAESNLNFNPTELYKQIFEYLKPGETVSKALCRLGKGKKPISSAERWKRKKAGLSETDENSEKIIKLTELANTLLTRTGNMDIYQETYEAIKRKIESADNKSLAAKPAELDMYSDDFDTKEQNKLTKNEVKPSGESSGSNSIQDQDNTENIVKWELKWSQNDDAEINGPHTTEQMFSWAKEGYFKSGAWVRRAGQAGEFYSASRIDFELYL
ncbi:CD2 antigen cytoplasmic tail-binding protein 2 homolog [Chelonus insularis]|uniref:CD2 antigen cytoplasmic tail-binding protein 2 homolog n=1 Tax=Chelonus insularis TaxID=460826 RepID=UPI00158EF82C|nr:CD2 antigen cytoplasmic tail-binding protein 2 homolog [Chelonus insularis]